MTDLQAETRRSQFRNCGKLCAANARSTKSTGPVRAPNDRSPQISQADKPSFVARCVGIICEPWRQSNCLKASRRGRRSSKRYWHYPSKKNGDYEHAKRSRLPADAIEDVVSTAAMNKLADRIWLADALIDQGKDASVLTSILRAATALVKKPNPKSFADVLVARLPPSGLGERHTAPQL